MNFARKGLKFSGRPAWWKCLLAVAPFLVFAPGLARAQTAPPASADAQQRERIERQLRELQSMKQDLQRQLGDFDARIRALEGELGAQSKPEITPPPARALTSRWRHCLRLRRLRQQFRLRKVPRT